MLPRPINKFAFSSSIPVVSFSGLSNPIIIGKFNQINKSKVSQFSLIKYDQTQKRFKSATTTISSVGSPAATTTSRSPHQPHQPAAERSAHSPKSTKELIAQREEKPKVESKFIELKISRPSQETGGDYLLPHPIWEGEYVNKVEVDKHHPPADFVDKSALYTIKTLRFNFDWMSGYSFGKLTSNKALTRIIFLESVAAIPGSIGGTLRHLASLRRMQRDNGWIHTLLEEAENERLHLLTAIQLKKPGPVMKTLVFLTQGVFFNFFWVAYLISPRFCHRLVGYLEEEAVHTYTRILADIDNGNIGEWANEPAPEIAKKYWHLNENATMRDVIAVIRADEAHHRQVNHTFASLKPDQLNPFKPGY